MLDRFADTRELRGRVRESVQAWKRAADEIAELESADQEKLRLLDLWQFQRQEIEAAELRREKIRSSTAERRVQQNAGAARDGGRGLRALYEAPESATAGAAVGREETGRTGAYRRFDAAGPAGAGAGADCGRGRFVFAARLSGQVEANPTGWRRLKPTCGIEKLKRKYGGSVEEILGFWTMWRGKSTRSRRRVSGWRLLRRDLAAAAREYEQASGQLTALRRRAAQELARRVEAELKPLAMERTVFRIEIESAAWSETGADRVSFLVSPNAGEAPKAMEKIASGGELSRIALALKTCLVGSRGGGSGAASVRTLVFDEIDTGIGGRAAEGVARRLKTLAAENQVLCVTHLAQIACFADHHYRVGKFEREGRTWRRSRNWIQRGARRKSGGC